MKNRKQSVKIKIIAVLKKNIGSLKKGTELIYQRGFFWNDQLCLQADQVVGSNNFDIVRK